MRHDEFTEFESEKHENEEHESKKEARCYIRSEFEFFVLVLPIFCSSNSPQINTRKDFWSIVDLRMDKMIAR